MWRSYQVRGQMFPAHFKNPNKHMHWDQHVDIALHHHHHRLTTRAVSEHLVHLVVNKHTHIQG